MSIIDLSNTKASINIFLEKIKYLTSPSLFKIIYDKYNRPEIYNKIRLMKISEVEKKNNFLFKNIFSINKNNNSQNLNSDSFQEQVVYTFYEQLFNDRVFICNLILINLAQIGFLKILNTLNLDKRTFIFLDNNRLIFNRLISVNKGLVTFLKGNIFINTLLCVYFISYYWVRKYYRPKNEEKYLLDNYRRSYLIYQKLF